MKWMNEPKHADMCRSAPCASNRAAMRSIVQCMALCTIAFSKLAFSADCELAASGLGPNPTLPSTISVSQDEIAVGVQFPSSTTSSRSSAYVSGREGICKFDEYVFTPSGKVVPNVTFKTVTGSTAAVFETGVPGIGYAVEVQDMKGGSPPSTPLIDGDLSMPLGSTRPNSTISARVTFVSTGPLETGSYSFPSLPLFNYRLKYQGAFLPGSSPSASAYTNGITVTARACRVVSGATNSVTLPTLVAASLKAVGDVASARSATFSVGLSCDANVTVQATLTDATNPANTGSTLSLGSSSTAKGVGIQILKKDSSVPLRFGPDSSAKGNTNQWMVGTSSAANTRISVPFEARYVKVAEKITPGSVRALSTITFSYQ
ncbi:fimbrial protein [Burkholderia cepacia]|uniref:fimbrial protein n=1 Tax=Burkholderia cepacia TaxID=292 RepID=UPI000ACD8D8C|nr:fimbrial protein [Burkholderia cepacia]